MKQQTICNPTGLPSAHMCINKSRLKVYHKESSPTYYLTKGTEFQLELFNPTSDTLLAKIHLNGTAIAQGGLVLRPGERVFLERYMDVAKKFLFDTYSVSNTAEVRAAIKDNGDLKVEFYRESKPTYCNPLPIIGGSVYHHHYHDWTYRPQPYYSPLYGPSYYPTYFGGTITTAGSSGTLNLTGGATCSSATYNASNASYTSGVVGSAGGAGVTMDSLDFVGGDTLLRSAPLKKKSIETGRVEKGASSDQKLEYVDKTFDTYAFHTVEYKMLPTSQKVNTTQDLNVKRYCTSCGSKQKEGFKFCPQCGTKV